jgi:prephenate dehydratase
MTLKIAHLGPTGTYAEAAAIAYTKLKTSGADFHLQPYPNIAQTLQAVADQDVELAIVPVENSIEGSVTMTLDTIWQIPATIYIQQALILPISHALISVATDLSQIEMVYSHPQALSQCQEWLQQHLPQAARISSNSTTAALTTLSTLPHAAAISSVRAANLYNLPALVHPINDYADNQTKFWVISLQPTSIVDAGLRVREAFPFAQRLAEKEIPEVCNPTSAHRSSGIESDSGSQPGGSLPDYARQDKTDGKPFGSCTSVAFSLRSNAPGGLMTALGFFAHRGLNLSRIESRPSKRSLGDYLFFIDIETDLDYRELKSALADLDAYAETVKNFGSYETMIIDPT